MTAISNADISKTPYRRAVRVLPAQATNWSGLRANGIWPGLFLAAMVAAAAYAVRHLPGMATFSTMILAIVIGIGFHNLVGTPAWAKQGVTFSLRRLLRIAIILLGLQLTIVQVIEVGGRGIEIIAATLVATFAFTVWMG
jgi:uncharacterized membrane protein YadS